MKSSLLEFIQLNSPDGGFLQSAAWRRFQESVGRKTFFVEEKNDDGELVASASVMTHSLPIAGNYFYVPRGPVFSDQRAVNSEQYFIFFNDLLSLAKKNKIGWIRIEPRDEKLLEIIGDLEINGQKLKVIKSSVDMQPREILVMDISKRRGNFSWDEAKDKI